MRLENFAIRASSLLFINWSQQRKMYLVDQHFYDIFVLFQAPEMSVGESRWTLERVVAHEFYSVFMNL